MRHLKYYLHLGIILVLVVFSVSAYAVNLTVSLKDFPSRAQTFIKQHFYDQSIRVLTVDEGLLQTKYIVMFDDNMELVFDNEGNWIMVNGVGRMIPVGFVHDKILAYLQNRFRNVDITYIRKRSSYMEVRVNDDVELVFDFNGNVLK